MRNAPAIITVDIEDWPQSTWDRALPITKRAEANTRRLMSLLESLDIRATLFVLGKFAEAYPDLIRELSAAGHEIASHGYGHVEVFEQTPDEFRDDVLCAKALLEDISGTTVMGYRAPDFSITAPSLWALPILAEAGYVYDSSIFPIGGSRYGIPTWPRHPVEVDCKDGRHITELPIATYSRFGRNWPIGGGGYHRLLPGRLVRHLTKRILNEIPFVFYCHPYEFDPQEMSNLPFPVPLKVRLHQGIGRRSFEGRFRSFIGEFGGRRIADFLGDAQTMPRVVPSIFAAHRSPTAVSSD